MIEQGLLEQLFGAISSGNWGVVVGVVVVGLVTLARALTRERLTAAADKLVSALAAVGMAVGVLLVAGTDPAKAVIIGLFASAASAGLIDAIRDVIPKAKVPPLLPLMVLFLALSSASCGRCVAERGIVDALSAGIGAVDQSVGDTQDDDARLALDASRGAVLLGEAAVDSCEMLRNGSADGWESWVGLALEAAYGLVGIFTSAGPEPMSSPGEIPPELLRAVDLLGGSVP